MQLIVPRGTFYFPIQKEENILLRISSLDVSPVSSEINIRMYLRSAESNSEFFKSTDNPTK